MTPRYSRRLAPAVALLTVALVPGLASLSVPTASAQNGPPPSFDIADLTTIGDPVAALPDLDERGTKGAGSTARRAAAALGAVDVRWNQFGTPSSLLPRDGSLGAAPGPSATAARAWLADHAAVFGLTRADTSAANLELVSNQPLVDSDARAVLFRQKFAAGGGQSLSSALDGMVTVGVADGQVAYVSSSLVQDPGTLAAGSLTPVAGWLVAARDVGVALPSLPSVGDIDVTETDDGWTRLTVPGFAQEQQARLRALPMADGSVRPVIEANVVNVAGGAATAYTVMVDAASSRVLHRQNRVDNENDASSFTGAVTATECGPMHTFEIGDDATKQIIGVAALANTLNDVTVKIFDPQDELLVTGDLGTSPEVAQYGADSIPAGTYSAQVCPFADPTAPFVPPGEYALTVFTSDAAADAPGGTGTQGTPTWRYFPANPNDTTPGGTPTNDVTGCWFTDGAAPGECTLPTGRLRNVAAPGPWDYLTGPGVPSFTTVGNNADTHEAWTSPLTPGGTAQAPYSPTQDYPAAGDAGAFTDAWNNSGCDPAQLRAGGNDINYSVSNLFVSHNRMHDFSYYLGFNEKNYNMQLENLGNPGVEGDPEVGNVQAGAISGGAPSYLGRDNANQITLQDGIPGITNQYLFQPIAGAFYAPCTDGGLDMGIVGHEYTHAISNRMVAGPDQGLTSEQGGAMGESWSDLVAAEYHFAHGYDNGGNTWAVGVYATGNESVAIRDYAINRNPLNYSDYGFDTTGDEVHADGEIWNGTQWSVRQALVKKYNATGNRRLRYSNASRQLACAQANPRSATPPADCPGNRRWIQLMFDSFLLQQGATSMLDARDAMIAADRMRFDGRDTKVMWDAFASRGMGQGASVPNADSGDTKPSFASPTSSNATLTLQANRPGQLYVGHYEARATPVADNLAKTNLGARVALVPGRHQMLFVSTTGGFKRFTVNVKPGQRLTQQLRVPLNLASAKAGASVIGSTAGSRNAASLIDGTEETNWGGVTEENVDASNPSVTVDLAGGRQTVRRVQVSAMLTPAQTSGSEVPLAVDQVDEDPDSGSRFTALRRFAIESCTSGCASESATWKRVYTSGADAFPGARPRPVAPDLIMRSFTIDATPAAALRLVALENQCTGFAGYAGEQDNDPLNATDCKTASDRGTIVHAAELQAFAR